MSEKELGDLLRDQLAAAEPAPMSPAWALRRGRRRRRVRTGLVAGATMAVAAGGVTFVATLDDTAERVTVAEPDGAGLQTVVEQVATELFSTHYTALPQPRVEVRDGEGKVVPPEHAGVSSVQAIFDLPGAAELAFGANAGTAQDRTGCTDWEQTGTAVDCSVRELADGTQVRVVVLAFGPPSSRQEPRAILTTAELPRAVTWSRSVTSFAPDGDITGGYELVQAPSYQAAQGTWRVPVEELIAATTDPELTAHDFD